MDIIISLMCIGWWLCRCRKRIFLGNLACRRRHPPPFRRATMIQFLFRSLPRHCTRSHSFASNRLLPFIFFVFKISVPVGILSSTYSIMCKRERERVSFQRYFLCFMDWTYFLAVKPDSRQFYKCIIMLCHSQFTYRCSWSCFHRMRLAFEISYSVQRLRRFLCAASHAISERAWGDR